MTLTIRRATPADAPVLVAFNAAIAWETEHKRLDPAVLAAGVGRCSRTRPAGSTPSPSAAAKWSAR